MMHFAKSAHQPLDYQGRNRYRVRESRQNEAIGAPASGTAYCGGEMRRARRLALLTDSTCGMRGGRRSGPHTPPNAECGI